MKIKSINLTENKLIVNLRKQFHFNMFKINTYFHLTDKYKYQVFVINEKKKKFNKFVNSVIGTAC